MMFGGINLINQNSLNVSYSSETFNFDVKKETHQLGFNGSSVVTDLNHNINRLNRNNVNVKNSVTVKNWKKNKEVIIKNISVYTAGFTDDDQARVTDHKTNKGVVKLDQATKALAYQQILNNSKKKYRYTALDGKLAQEHLNYLALHNKPAVQELAQKQLIKNIIEGDEDRTTREPY